MDFIIGPTYEDPNTAFGERLSELVDCEDEMNEWENEFLGHMVDKFEKGENFSDPQIETINKMYETYVL